MNNRPTHFELPVDDVERAQKFWTSTFGWQFHKFGEWDYWLVQTGEGPGIDGGMMPRNPGQPVVNSITVESIDNAISAVEANGGTIVVPKRAIPGVGWLAYFTDPDGNIHGIMQNDPLASV